MEILIWFLVNSCCVFAYFILSTIFLILLYYFRVLSESTQVRLKFNIIDFWLDFCKLFSYDLHHRVKDSCRERGIIFYEGPQGSGKTISMVRDIYLLQKKYKKVKVIDNFNYKHSDCSLSHPSQLIDFDNGVYGVISAIDECGIWFNNRDYKTFSDSGMLQIIFENRKVRRLLLGSTQKFMLVDKNLRIQTSLVRSCHSVCGITYYIEKIPDFDSEGNVIKYRFHGFKVFVQTTDLRDMYDTYHVIKKFKTL